MGGPVLGIDLGTTNSVVAVESGDGVRVLRDAEGHALVPSVVSFHPDGQILVGRTARERRLLDAMNTVYSVKRLIGRPFPSDEVRRAVERFPFELTEGPTGGVLVVARGDQYSLSEISAFVLRQVRAQAEQALGHACDRAVVTVPANFNELQRSATKAAGRVAGLEVLRILNEPTAAALAYGYGRGSRERIAVFDLGGGTFDITILDLAGEVFEVLATAGDTYLGGDDVDDLVADQMAEAFVEHHRYDPRTDRQAFERLRVAAEWAKCQLSEKSEVQLRVEELAYGEDGVALDLAFGLTRQALERIAQPLLGRAFDVCEDAMRVAGVRPTQLDNVILVGGATRMPLVQRMVDDYFGRKPLSDIDPDLVVAQGAAIQGQALAGRARTGPTTKVGRVRLRRMSAAQLEASTFGAVPREPMDDRPTAIRQSEYPPPEAYRPDAPPPPPAVPPSPPAVPPPPPAVPPSAPAVPPSPPPEATRPGNRTLEGVAPAAPPPPPPEATRPGNRTLDGMAPAPAPPPAAPAAPLEDDERTVPSMAAPAVESPGPLGTKGWSSAPPPLDAGSAEPEPEPVAPKPPLLLDVTPLSLGVETVGGYCEHIIKRNAAIPVEQSRIFSTAQDEQSVVKVRICQGESRRLGDNQLLGEIELSGLRPAPRGQVRIDVTFLIDADGTLGVRARDMETGREQSIRINLIGGVHEEEVDRMQRRHDDLFAARTGG